MAKNGQAEKLTNTQIISEIVENSSLELQARVPQTMSVTGQELLQVLDNYPTAKNEFIQSLTNKVVKSNFFSKVWNNPLRQFHKGFLPFGKSLEQLFVEMAERKGFYDGSHYKGSTTDEGDLIGKTVPEVKAMYITQDFAWQYKCSISDEQLKGAFTSQYGLSDLIIQLTNSVYRRAYLDEYEMMLGILTRKGTETKEDGSFVVPVGADGTPTYNSPTAEKGVIQRIVDLADADSLPKQIETIEWATDELGAKKLSKAVRRDISKFGFVKNDYNLAKVYNFANPEDLVLFTTPEIKAELDVEVMANAFNISYADIDTRIQVVDDLGVIGETLNTSIKGKEILGVLCDKDIIQQHETINTTESFRVPSLMRYNIFHNRQGISATCDFANCKVFVKA